MPEGVVRLALAGGLQMSAVRIDKYYEIQRRQLL